MDALEVSTRLLPNENGGFLQVSGIRFKVDTSVTTSVVMDENGQFSHVEGNRRVSDVEILDKENNEYHAIEPDRTYSSVYHNAAKYSSTSRNHSTRLSLDTSNILSKFIQWQLSTPMAANVPFFIARHTASPISVP